MSLLFIDGFDHYGDIRRKYQVVSSLEFPTFVAGRFGGSAMKKQFQNGAGTNTRSFGQQSDVTFGIAYFPPGFPGSTESMWRFVDLAGTVIMSVSVSSTGILAISAGGQVDTSLSALPTAQYSYIEVHYIPLSVGGLCELRVDEVVVATITGDTTTQADADVAGFQLLDNGTNSPRYLLDDLYILNASGATNNAYLGDSRITTMFPKADGTLNDWTPSAVDPIPANFTMTDDPVLDSDTTFVESGLVGASEDYDNEDFTDKGFGGGTIFGVQVANATKRTDAGTIRHKHEMVIAGARFDDGTEDTAGAGNYFVDTFIRDTDPSDSGTWTDAKVAAVGSGLTITFKET